jgi:hypothetical protein
MQYHSNVASQHHDGKDSSEDAPAPADHSMPEARINRTTVSYFRQFEASATKERKMRQTSLVTEYTGLTHIELQ